MKLEDHELRCLDVLGTRCTDIHKYLDQYFPLFRYDAHRAILHHQKGINKIIRLFASQYGSHGQYIAEVAARLHIKDDMGFIPEEFIDAEKKIFFLTCEDYELADGLYAKEFP